MPQTQQQQTAFGGVLVDLAQSFFTGDPAGLTPAGCSAFSTVFGVSVGKFLDSVAQKRPNLDLWNDPQYAEFPTFLRGVAQQIGKGVAAKSKGPASDTVFLAVAQAVMDSKAVDDDCEKVLADLAKIVGAGILPSGICWRGMWGKPTT